MQSSSCVLIGCVLLSRARAVMQSSSCVLIGCVLLSRARAVEQSLNTIGVTYESSTDQLIEALLVFCDSCSQGRYTLSQSTIGVSTHRVLTHTHRVLTHTHRVLTQYPQPQYTLSEVSESGPLHAQPVHHRREYFVTPQCSARRPPPPAPESRCSRRALWCVFAAERGCEDGVSARVVRALSVRCRLRPPGESALYAMESVVYATESVLYAIESALYAI